MARKTKSLKIGLGLIGILVIAFLFLRTGNLLLAAQDMLTLTLGLLVEAMPFVVVGVVFSSLIQTYISTEIMAKYLFRSTFLRRIQLSLMGLVMPVCECGNVPVARSLVAKGVHPADSIMFLLSAPSINIVTIYVTSQAFNFAPSVNIFRIAGTLIASFITVAVLSRFVKQNEFLTPDFKAVCAQRDHSTKSVSSFLSLYADEVWRMGRLLVVGALIAAASQVLVPRDVITSIGSQPILAVCAMLILAFVVSICSSVDSFFALAYINSFNLGSIVTFLIAGPMVDIKMVALMKTTFKTRVIAMTAAVVGMVSALMGVILSYAWY